MVTVKNPWHKKKSGITFATSIMVLGSYTDDHDRGNKLWYTGALFTVHCLNPSMNQQPRNSGLQQMVSCCYVDALDLGDELWLTGACKRAAHLES